MKEELVDMDWKDIIKKDNEPVRIHFLSEQ